MAKKRKPELPGLVRALDFLLLSYKAGETQSTYAMFKNGRVSSFNLTIACGTTIEEDIDCCPHLAMLSEAINNCGTSTYSITQLSSEKLLVRSDEFQAYIPCVTPQTLQVAEPNSPVGMLDERFTKALQAVSALAVTKAETVIECSILLNSHSCIATNRNAIMEAWHGIDFPNGLLIPKIAVSVLAKSKKEISSFGFSKETLTFFFTDGSWMRTQLYQDVWPPIERHLNHPSLCRPVPPQLFSAAKKVAPFSMDEHVYIKDGLISSHPFDRKEEGSSLKLPIGSDHAERSYRINDLNLISKYVTQWDETSKEEATIFLGESLRGVIHHDKPNNKIDEDIPF
jgi:hypothetical protein